MTLVEKALLDRLRQKQVHVGIRHPILVPLSKIQQEIEDIINNGQMSDDLKLSLLKLAQGRFTKLKEQLAPSRDAGPIFPIHDPREDPLDAGPPLDQAGPHAAAVVRHQIDAEPILPEAVAGDALAQPGAVQASPADEAMLVKNAALMDARGDSTHGPSLAAKSLKEALSTITLPNQYGAKFGELRKFLEEHKGVVSSNSKKEIVVEGEAIPGSSFHDLFRSLYIKNRNQNLTGLKELTLALSKVNAGPELFSNKEFISSLKDMTTSLNTLSTTSSLTRSLHAKNIHQPLSSTPVGGPAPQNSPYATASEDEVAQEGNGKKRYIPHGSRKKFFSLSGTPPGKAAKILRLYR